MNVGASADPLSLHVMSWSAAVVRSRVKVGVTAITQEMLDPCAEHEIGADDEFTSADKVNEAYERVRECDRRYRFVNDTSTLA